MKHFTIRTKYPVPSCVVGDIIWDDDKKEWSFEYNVIIPADTEIIDGKFSKDLYVYGHIQQLKLVEHVTKNSVNITVRSLEEVEMIIHDQYLADLEFRENWIKENPEYIDKVFIVEIENKTQYSDFNHLVSIVEIKEDTTLFVAAPQKWRVNANETKPQ